MEKSSLKRVDKLLWEIPKAGDMNVPGEIFASEELIEEMDEKVREQVTNVACLPGIQCASISMPDAHWGYGFPIGGVAAFDPEEGGIISMGGVGFDIACGVRTLKTGLVREAIRPKLKELIETLFRTVPAGLGSTGEIRLKGAELDDVLTGGAVWAVDRGYGTKEDLEYTEEKGVMGGADPRNVSDHAKKREEKQVGTLGSGNHYLEIQYVNEIYDSAAADVLGINENDILIAIHCGSRGLGHQIGTDYLKSLGSASAKYGIALKDRELACAPIKSKEGQQYLAAMYAGVNCALANRQVIAHLVRQVFEKIFPQATVQMIYDVSHNTCKPEEHLVSGKKKKVYVHRKGATRAFGPKRQEIPRAYAGIGQPVLIGGTMGTCSYIMVGTEYGTERAFGSACHGAGRSMSRTQAKKTWRGEKVVRELESRGIIVKAHSYPGVAEEAPGAYKDVTQVVDAVHKANLARKVAMVKPLACIKG
jgi:tRNA-splicing ligase RtcB